MEDSHPFPSLKGACTLWERWDYDEAHKVSIGTLFVWTDGTRQTPQAPSHPTPMQPASTLHQVTPHLMHDMHGMVPAFHTSKP